MDNKKGQFKVTPGLAIRFIALLFVVSTVPFLVLNPSNIIAQVLYGFGNFLFIIGGFTE